jgi:hypothetical protein
METKAITAPAGATRRPRAYRATNKEFAVIVDILNRLTIRYATRKTGDIFQLLKQQWRGGEWTSEVIDTGPEEKIGRQCGRLNDRLVIDYAETTCPGLLARFAERVCLHED